MFFPNGIGSTEIVTAKSSEMNIMLPKPGEQDMVSHVLLLCVFCDMHFAVQHYTMPLTFVPTVVELPMKHLKHKLGCEA